MTENLKKVYIPITRAFDGKDGHFVYGELPFEPDELGTMLSKELVENNIPRLKKYPSARFMHREPVGKIDFEHTVNGYRTYVDDRAFHILIKLFDVCEKEFKIISEGNYGLSYGLMPQKTEHKQVNGKDVEVFTEGTLYEVSIVDSPALDSPITIVRSAKAEKRITFQGFDKYELDENNNLHIPEPEPEQPKPLDQPTAEHRHIQKLLEKQERGMLNPNFEQSHRKRLFPEICSEECQHVQCPYRKRENYGKKCLQLINEPNERSPIFGAENI